MVSFAGFTVIKEEGEKKNGNSLKFIPSWAGIRMHSEYFRIAATQTH